MSKERLYTMALHEEIAVDAGGYTVVMRVPGGWIYKIHQPRIDYDNLQLTTVFVPFHKEYMP